ncbi:hypothetical protein AGMMS50268_18620 [Spirochaetia bacterium]|nr:hypothetical protein AGMMS50268_18620 [Spirochaetia bacterium]
MRLSALYFGPDNDGIDDELTIYLSAADESGIGRWSFEIREPQAPNFLFYKWEGTGAPPAELKWDGYSADGHELVQSAEEYRYVFTAADTLDNVSSLGGGIQVDILVFYERDLNLYRARVPAIVFGSNSGGFEGLPRETMDNNDWILRRIAQTLNKDRFSALRVKVEGHSNPTTTPNTRARQQELRGLQSLSELRAKTVVDYLEGIGVDRSRMNYVGIGASRPIVTYEDRDNWWKNRRVEFLLDR